MAEQLFIPHSQDRKTVYRSLLPQIHAVFDGEPNLVANLANLAAILHQAFGFLWVGFYLDSGKDLVLGPFQGPLACTRIPYGKGVCGTAYATGKTQLIPDVHAFPGHIVCSDRSNAEIVVPIYGKDGKVALVLDIDSERKADFSEIDQKYLEEIGRMVGALT